MSRPQPPCQFCEDRTPTCHHDGTCTHGWEEYEKALKEYHAIRTQAVNAERDVNRSHRGGRRSRS